jgi:ORF6N domain
MATKKKTTPVAVEHITQSILILRGQRVLLDSQLAALYGVETRMLNQAVKRNAERFPEDFRFQLTAEEATASRSQIVILKSGRYGTSFLGRNCKSTRRYCPISSQPTLQKACLQLLKK